MNLLSARLRPALGAAFLPLLVSLSGGTALAEVAGQGQIPDPVIMLLPGASRPGADPLQLLQNSKVQRDLGLNDGQIDALRQLNQRTRSTVGSLTRTRGGPPAGLSAGAMRGQENQRRSAEQDARQKVGEILSPAQLQKFQALIAAQPGADPLELLLSADTVRTLALSSDQVQQLRQVSQQVRAAGQPRTRGGDPDAQRLMATRGQLEQQVRSAREQVAQILTAEQLHRLRQILLQLDPTALADPVVEKRLDLTPAQKKQLVAIQEEQVTGVAEGFKPVRSRSGQAVAQCQAADANRAALAPVLQKSRSRARGVLTTEQQERLTTLQGKPLALEAPPCAP